MTEVIETPVEEVAVEVDIFEGFSKDYTTVEEIKDLEGFITRTINVDGYQITVTDKVRNTKEAVDEISERTAQEVRKNRQR